jgi:2-amino-4-hydroxy-6-hydroxymethyldihydropteridine diphosphokinase
MPVVAYLGLGSNVGERAAFLEAGLRRLQEWPGIELEKVSRFWETPAAGGPPGQGDYLNAVAAIRTTLTPQELMQALLAIEREHGRERLQWSGPRTLDLDLLLYGDMVLSTPELTIPHPRMHLRRFVLGPLAELAPTLVHPGLHKTIAQLLAEVGQRPLLGRRAVVTGASRGIGRAIACALAQRGADVLVHARAARQAAEETAERVRQQGVTSAVLLADLSQPAACRSLVEAAWHWGKGLDIWVNNAGADVLTGEQARWSFEDKLHLLWEVDVRGSILLSRDVGQRMYQQGWGCILTLGWDQADSGMGGDSGELFAATKGAVMAFTRSLAVSLAPRVRVNCVAPGWIRTAWGESASEVWQKRAVSESLLRRWGTPEDVAGAVCWLASADADFVTGQVIRVGGGAVR